MRLDRAAGSLRDEIESLGPWFHNLHLPDGTQTAPAHFLGDFPARKWAEVAADVPAGLRGWTALDVGCNAGFYAIELARRGADVTGLEVEPLYLRQARWAARQFGLESRLRFVEGTVHELLRMEQTWDFVWFTGVFYHLRHPLLALDLVRRATRRLMMFQTMTMPGDDVLPAPDDLPLDARDRMLDPGWPRMAFIENRVANDATNWWAPNHACVEALLRSAGFEVIARPAHEFYLCRPVADPRHEELEHLLGLLRGAPPRRAP